MVNIGRLFVFCVVLLFSVAAYALGLDEAKQAGLVGEQPTGYVAAVSSRPTLEVKELVNDINRKRQAHYSAISQQTGQALDVVEVLAAKKLLNRVQPGEYYQMGGQWLKK